MAWPIWAPVAMQAMMTRVILKLLENFRGASPGRGQDPREG